MAEVTDDRWVHCYPGVAGIRCSACRSSLEGAASNGPLPGPDSVTHLVVFEKECAGYYQRGDLIEVRGVLQRASNVPVSPGGECIGTRHQVLVGTIAGKGREYVRLRD
jgi:predicted nucleotidyltransferase